MKLNLIYLSLSFLIINTPISAMERVEAKNEKQALLDKKLHIAVELQDSNKVEKLINKGADVNSDDGTGSYPLLSAINKGSWEIVNHLLTRDDIDVTVKDSQGWTPLFAASRQGSLETVKKLIAKGADVNAVTYDVTKDKEFIEKGMTPREIAFEKQDKEQNAILKQKYTDIILALEPKK
jgi:ankyrin repeat protein